MPRAQLTALAAVAVIGILAVLLWPEADNPDVDPLENPTQEASQEESPQEAATVEVPELGGQRVESEPEIPAAESKPAAPREYTEYTASNATLVKVMEKDGKKPVPFADVWVLTQGDMTDERALESAFTTGESTIEEIIREYGQVYRADQDGIARVKPLSDFPMVFARKENLSGMSMRVDVAGNDVELLLEPDLRLTVSVTYPNGEPAAHAPISMRMGMDGFSYTLFTRESDADGELVFENLRPLLENSPGMEVQMFVGIGMPMPDDIDKSKTEVVVDDAVLESGYADLEMPDSGRVQVKITTHDGRPFQDDAVVSLSRANDGNEDFEDRGVAKRIRDGMVTFPYVGLGLEYELYMESLVTEAYDQFSFVGPTRPGELVEVEWQRSARPTLRYRVMHPRGMPVATGQLEAQLVMNRSEGRDSTRQALISLSTDGWVEQEVDPDWLADEAIDSLTLKLRFQDQEEGLLTVSQLLPPLGTSVVDLGELQLEPAPVLLRGTVLDAERNPVPQALVYLEISEEPFPSRYFPDYESPVRTTSKDDGSFVLQGELSQSDSYALHARAPGFEDYRQEIAPAGQEFTVQLVNGSFLTGTILLDPRVMGHTISLYARRGEHHTDWIDMGPGSEEGVYHFTHQATPGEAFTFLVETDAGEIAYELPNLVLSPGETLQPAELQPLDLSQVIRVVEIRAVDPAGNPAEASVAIHGEDGSWHHQTSFGGTFHIATLQGLKEVVVTAPKLASVSLENVTTDQLVQMQAAIEVYFQIDAGLLAEDDVELQVYARPTGSGRSYYGGSTPSKFDPNGRSTGYADGPGEYDVHIMATVRGGTSRYSSGVHNETVSISAAGQVVHLNIDRKRLQRHIDKSRDRE